MTQKQEISYVACPDLIEAEHLKSEYPRIIIIVFIIRLQLQNIFCIKNGKKKNYWL